MNLRLFVALQPSDRVRHRLSAFQSSLRDTGGHHADDFKWTAVEDIHLTLQFLGAVPEERLDGLKAALASVASATPTFHLELHGGGGFPNARRARVLWAGVRGDLAALSTLTQRLGHALAPRGFTPEERDFSPHLTLARSRDPHGTPGFAAALAQLELAPGALWPIGELVLFQSQLSPRGARYQPIAIAPFTAGG